MCGPALSRALSSFLSQASFLELAYSSFHGYFLLCWRLSTYAIFSHNVRNSVTVPACETDVIYFHGIFCVNHDTTEENF